MSSLFYDISWHAPSPFDGLAAQVEDETTSMPVLWVVLKGAPEVVRQFLANPLADYDKSYKQFAAQGARFVSSSA